MARDSDEATEHLDRALIIMKGRKPGEADLRRAALHLAAAQTMAFGALVEAINVLTNLVAVVIDAPTTVEIERGSIRVSEQ